MKSLPLTRFQPWLPQREKNSPDCQVASPGSASESGASGTHCAVPAGLTPVVPSALTPLLGLCGIWLKEGGGAPVTEQGF